jgi:deoxyribodipyrimidine photo-lyase
MNISTLCWLRRDLRLSDNTALHHALAEARLRNGSCLSVFVFDTEILEKVPDRSDRRVSFLHGSIDSLRRGLRAAGSDLLVLHGKAQEVIPSLVARLATERGLEAVHVSHDHETRRLQRDSTVQATCRSHGVRFSSWKDIVVFEKDEVLSATGTPLRVYSPYRKAWTKRLEEAEQTWLAPRDPDLGALVGHVDFDFPPGPSLAQLGFEAADAPSPGEEGARERLRIFLERMDGYREHRDFVDQAATSQLGIDLRFGTVSIRSLMRAARARERERPDSGATTWLSELVWREFYQMLLHHFPASEHKAFQGRFEAVVWDDPDTNDLVASRWVAWCEGRTGFPMVDAAMRQFAATGWMHNRARMVVASFLTKDLHIHWKRGERFFARSLLDYDLAQNVGGWQWSASTGADGQPYFRVFNPCSQGERFDPQGAYVRRWCPELSSLPERWIHRPFEAPEGVLAKAGVTLGGTYPAPVVDHSVERLVAMERFKVV